jgi:hypothetical protein
MLAQLTVGPRVTNSFRGGPLAGIVLDSQSADEGERWDVAWLIVKTGGGQLGGRFRAIDRLRSQGGQASMGEYEIRSRVENAEGCQLFLYYNANQTSAPEPPAE